MSNTSLPPPELRPGCPLPLEDLRPWLKHCGRDVKMFSGCRLTNPERIEIDDASQIDEGVRVFAGDGVVIGRYVHLAFGSSISGGGWCGIGDFAGIGAATRLITGTDVVDGSGLTNPTVPAEFRAVRRGRIEIGAHAVLFTNVLVLPDVSIGEGAVVSAGSVVHHDLAPWSIYAGNPLVKVGVRPRERVLELAGGLRCRRESTVESRPQ